MTREEIVDLFQRRDAAMNDLDLEGLTALYAEDAVVESPFGGTHQGRAAIRAVFDAVFEAFDDATVTTDDLIVDGDRFVHVLTMSGTNTGSLMGMEPSGRPAHVPMVWVGQVANGVIVRERRIYDFTGMLVQIGVLKAKPA